MTGRALDVENGTAKGYFNASDINRIEGNLEYLRDYATALGYTVSATLRLYMDGR